MTFLDQCGRRIKKELLSLLKQDDWEARLKEQLAEPSKLICPLFAGLLNRNTLIRWRSISAFGIVVPVLAEDHMEKARVVMRRFIWNLNEESGGIGWGIPEAMGEVIASHDRLGTEFHKVLFSYIHEKDGPDNFIDHEPLRAGAYWGAARVAQSRPDLAERALPDLLHGLETETNPTVLGYVCLALGLLGETDARPGIEKLTDNDAVIQLYWNRELKEVTLGELATASLKRIADGER